MGFIQLLHLYRSSIFLKKPLWLYSHSTDYPNAILAILNGRIGYIDKVTACYWKNPRSVSNKTYEDKTIAKDAIYKKYIKFIFFDKILIQKLLEQELEKLIAKEDYVCHSKFSDQGLYFDSLKGVLR